MNNLNMNNRDTPYDSNTKAGSLFVLLQRGEYDTIADLLANPGCNVNEEIQIEEDEYKTALMEVVSKVQSDSDQYAKIMRSLMNHSLCDVNYRTTRSPYSYKAQFTAIHYAAENESPVAMEILLSDKRCEINTKDYHKRVALHIAADRGHTKVALALLNHPRCHVNTQDDAQWTPLHRAACAGHTDIVRLLTRHPQCDVNLQDQNKRTPLHAAAYEVHADSVQLLLNHPHIQVNMLDDEDRTALHRAVAALPRNRTGLKRILEYFVSHPQIDPSFAAVDEKGDSALTKFVRQCGNMSNFTHQSYFVDCLNTLLKKREALKTLPHTFALAVERLPVKMCEEMLKKYTIINDSFKENETALHCAVRVKSVKKTELLMSYKPGIKTWMNHTPLQQAIAHGSNPTILRLLGTDLNQVEECLSRFGFVGETALTCAIRLGVIPWVQHFVTQYDVTEPDATGLNALQLSTKRTEIYNIVNHHAPPTCKRDNKDLKEMRKWYAYKSLSSNSIHTSRAHISPVGQLQLVKLIASSHLCNTSAECSDVNRAVMSFVADLSEQIASDRDTVFMDFIPILTGSVSEGTKTFIANEIDIACKFKHIEQLRIHRHWITVTEASAWSDLQSRSMHDVLSLDPRKVSQRFYRVILQAIKSLIKAGRKYGYLHLHHHALELRDKVSCVHLLWRGLYFKDMVVYIDLVPAFPLHDFEPDIPLPLKIKSNDYYFIPKSSRHDDSKAIWFLVSHSVSEKTMIHAVPENVKRGFLIAKALRAASISQPSQRELQSLRLEEANFSTEDFITSYMLKTCLFNMLKEKDLSVFACDFSGSPCDWADRIYRTLEMCILDGKLLAYYKKEYVFECRHDMRQSLKFECCLKRRVRHSLCCTIRKWLRNNKSELEQRLYNKQTHNSTDWIYN